MNFSAVILAGGKSSRMGRDKAWLEIDGELLLTRQIRVAREAGADEVVISGRADTDYSAFDSRVVQDRRGEAGPLGGIESAFSVVTSSVLLVLAVDMPKMQARLLRQFASQCGTDVGVIPRVNGKIEPLAAFYPKAAACFIEELFSETGQQEKGRNMLGAQGKSPSMIAFAEQCIRRGLAQFVALSQAEAIMFENWNSPERLK